MISANRKAFRYHGMPMSPPLWRGFNVVIFFGMAIPVLASRTYAKTVSWFHISGGDVTRDCDCRRNYRNAKDSMRRSCLRGDRYIRRTEFYEFVEALCSKPATPTPAITEDVKH